MNACSVVLYGPCKRHNGYNCPKTVRRSKTVRSFSNTAHSKLEHTISERCCADTVDRSENVVVLTVLIVQKTLLC